MLKTCKDIAVSVFFMKENNNCTKIKLCQLSDALA